MLVLSRVFKRTFYSIFGKQTRIDIYYIEGRDLYKNDSNKTSFHPIKLLEQKGKRNLNSYFCYRTMPFDRKHTSEQYSNLFIYLSTIDIAKERWKK